MHFSSAKFAQKMKDYSQQGELILREKYCKKPWCPVKISLGLLCALIGKNCVMYLWTRFSRVILKRSHKPLPPVYFSSIWGQLGNLVAFSKNPISFLTEGTKQCGGFYGIPVLHKKCYFAFSASAHHFFNSNDAALDQADPYQLMVPVFGNDVIYAVDEHTRRAQIGLLRKALSPQVFPLFAGICEEQVHLHLKTWVSGDQCTVHISTFTREAMVRTSGTCIFGEGMNLEKIGPLLKTLENGITHLSFIWPNFPIPEHWHRDRARREIEPFFQAEIDRIRVNSQGRHSFLGSLLQEQYDGTILPDSEITGLCIAAHFGGMHNSSITSAWILLRCAQDKHLYHRLRTEQMNLFDSPDAPISYELLKQMHLLKATIYEVLRTTPPLFFLLRKVLTGLEFEGYQVPKGSYVGVCTKVSHDVGFATPEIFNIDRFIDPSTGEASVAGYPTFSAFGNGRRRCVGEHFGILQICTFLSILLRNYTFELQDLFPEYDCISHAVGQPATDCRVLLKKIPAEN